MAEPPDSLEAALQAYLKDADPPAKPPPTRRERSHTPLSGVLPFVVGRTDRGRGAGQGACPYTAERDVREWTLGWLEEGRSRARTTGGPYVAGLKARQQDQRLAANPHPVGSPDSAVWERGWYDGGAGGPGPT